MHIWSTTMQIHNSMHSPYRTKQENSCHSLNGKHHLEFTI
jgi:hypothetical protein